MPAVNLGKKDFPHFLLSCEDIWTLSTQSIFRSPSFTHIHGLLTIRKTYLEPCGHVEALTSFFTDELLPLWYLGTVHVRVMRLETLVVCRVENFFSDYKPLAQVVPLRLQTLTSIVKNKTHNPYLQWNSPPVPFSASLDNKWPEWYIHQGQINCEIKRSLFK